MGVDKVILRAFLSTLAAIAVLFVFMGLALCAFFPSTMMEVAYGMGMETSSIHFAERAYKGSDDVYYIAYATEVAIEDEQKSKVIECGEQFLAHKEFSAYCEEKGERADSYKRFVYSQVCVAKYDEGQIDEAIALAGQSLDEGRFSQGNAFVALLVRSIEKEDTAAQAKVKAAIEGLTVAQEDEGYKNQVLALLAR